MSFYTPPPIHIGFTGTQHGATRQQIITLTAIISPMRAYVAKLRFHHGDCMGADAQAHSLCCRLGIPIILHPPDVPNKRAFCQHALETRAEKYYLARNHDIVDECGIICATPHEATMQLRSGTWATIRYAQKRHRDLRIILPCGTIWQAI